MKVKIVIPLITALGTIFITGCATDAHYVQTGDKEQIISVGQINIQDYANAANDAVNQLLTSGALDKVSSPPAVLFVSRIINNTGQQVEIDLLTQKITKALLDSGKALITTTDPAAKGYQQENQFLNDQQNTRLPDFTLSGKIIETIDRSGDTSRHTYTFQLSLNDTKTGYQVWEGEKEIGKQGTRSTIGF
ncbi:MAG: penicillin-binding protein activator LpoB [Limisphaerales bacterium]